MPDEFEVSPVPQEPRVPKIAWVWAALGLSTSIAVVLLLPTLRGTCYAYRLAQRQAYASATDVLDAASKGDIDGVIAAAQRLPEASDMQSPVVLASRVSRLTSWMRYGLWAGLLLSLAALLHVLRLLGPRPRPRFFRIFTVLSLSAVIFSVFLTGMREIEGRRAQRTRACAMALHTTVYEPVYAAALRGPKAAQADSQADVLSKRAPVQMLRDVLKGVGECTYEVMVTELTQEDFNATTMIAADAGAWHIEFPLEFRRGRNVLFGDGHVEFMPEDEFRARGRM